LNFFVVFRILYTPGGTINGIWGNDNSSNILASNDRYIYVINTTSITKVLMIGYGGGRKQIRSFPSKASPLTLNFSVLSIHYNSIGENSSAYCNGKYKDAFTEINDKNGENTFSIGFISSSPSPFNSQKHIAYFSLYHGRFSRKDILIQHKYLRERYGIDHDPITIS